MADDVTPTDVRARQFDAVRRGYDRAQVDEYLSYLAQEIERLRRELDNRRTKELSVGLDDPAALALELGTIGGEVAAILEAARASADGMRSRAAADVAEWRTSAESETQALSSDASEQSQSMRAAAWNEGSSMLSSSVAEAKALVDSAREDALFIRAEAEREAIRLTGDAKRDREELIRGARLETEEMIESARGESNGMLAAASQQAEQAQERARALEDRRSELLSELESTRASIGLLEEEIDSRKQELEEPELIVEPQAVSPTHHGSDSGSVRIVAPSRSRTLRPVDAEELVADVVALRSGMAVATDTEISDSSEPEPLEPDPPEPDPPELATVETVAVIAPPPIPTVENARLEDTDVETDEEQPATGNTSGSTLDTDDIGSLFASLRETTEETPAEDVKPAAREERTVTEPDSPSADPEPVADSEDPEDLDAALIPLQNAALKEIKRTLVDLQNDALEHLRTDTDWTPKKSFTNKFKAPFNDLALGITESRDDAGAAKEFSDDLNEAVVGAIMRTRESGAGDREIASSVSRVFRMWRADESERRVVDAALELSSLR
ncbi:MAG: DivIVA domain-containing protein [Actinomycetia bacterium]|nr:DivIVA domain-containing protein [Actinomycetes bacterium]